MTSVPPTFGVTAARHYTVAAVFVSVMRCPLCWHEPGCRQLGWCRGCWVEPLQSCSYWYCKECSDILQCCEVCGERFQHPAEYFPLLKEQYEQWLEAVGSSQLLKDIVNSMYQESKDRVCRMSVDLPDIHPFTWQYATRALRSLLSRFK